MTSPISIANLVRRTAASLAAIAAISCIFAMKSIEHGSQQAIHGAAPTPSIAQIGASAR